jgi:hypothetical protein
MQRQQGVGVLNPCTLGWQLSSRECTQHPVSFVSPPCLPLHITLARDDPQATISLAASDLAAQAGAGGSPLAEAAAAAAAGGRMEVVVSLAMYLTELALLDAACLAYPGSHLATAALLLAHATLAADCKAWPGVLAAAGLTEGDVARALAVLSRLHVSALLPPSGQLAELLMPLKVKFGQDCWCQVAAGVTPLSLQHSGAPAGGNGGAAAAAVAAAAAAAGMAL